MLQLTRSERIIFMNLLMEEKEQEQDAIHQQRSGH